jgi:preprotein translocase subunit SecA
MGLFSTTRRSRSRQALNLRQGWKLAHSIIAARPQNRLQSDESLSACYARLRHRVALGETLSSPIILSEVCSLIDEALFRSLGVELYPVQLLAGAALATGCVVEMQTGEGKTFTAGIAAAIATLACHNVHVASANSYLATRDAEQLCPAFKMLGLTAASITSEATPVQKRAAYACDITYAASQDFGFDFLRDQLARNADLKSLSLGHRYESALFNQAHRPLLMQRGHHTAILDEVDYVLLDGACSPLIISTQPPGTAPDLNPLKLAEGLVKSWSEGIEFIHDPQSQAVQLTQLGIELSESAQNEITLSELHRPWQLYVEQAIQARHVLCRDIHYIVRDSKLQLVDQTTGRIVADRSWRHGLQQATECAAGLVPKAESTSDATISPQRYFQLYKNLCGLTGTASGGEAEFHQLFHLPVVVVPPHRPSQRQLLPISVSNSKADKLAMIVAHAREIHQTGQPLLLGTRTIADSIELANQLERAGIPCQLLNGHQEAAEATSIARAGQPASVTVATSIAGRGTDIHLPPESLRLGGLSVLVTEPADSTRIDRQLIGRAARQGQPGSARIFTSPEDRLWADARINHLSRPTSRSTATAANQLIRAAQAICEAVARHQRRLILDANNRRESLFQSHSPDLQTNYQEIN